MAKRLKVSDEAVCRVRVIEDRVPVILEVISATGRNRYSDYQRLCRMSPLLAVRVIDAYHLVGLPGVRPLSQNCIEVVGPADSSIVVEADPKCGFVSRRV
ncbi:MAG: hypothetical protein AAB630_03705 [Patescibacteria group bacterium]